MSRHLDLDDLADLLAGEGGEREVRHVAGCAVCSGALDELDRAQAPVRAALAALPDPAVPADLPARLDAALLRAWETETTGTVGTAPGPSTADGAARSPLPGGDTDEDRPEDAARTPTGSAAVVPLRPRPRADRRPAAAGRWLLAGAAGIVLVLVAGLAVLVARQPGGGDSSTSSASSGSSAARPAGPAVTSTTGTDYAAGAPALAAALPALLQGTPTAASAPEALASTADLSALARLRDPAALADCLGGFGGSPLALDYARYAGAPALVAVLPTADPARLRVVVVGADCRAGAPATLLDTELARPS